HHLVPGDAGVGHQHLDRALLLLDLLEGLLDLLGVGDVTPDGKETLRRFAGAEGDGDLVTCVGEGSGDGEADAPIASGDEYRAAQRPTLSLVVLSTRKLSVRGPRGGIELPQGRWSRTVGSLQKPLGAAVVTGA